MKRILLALVVLLAVPSLLAAQAYPSKPIRIVVPYAAGGGVDTVVRAMTQELSKGLGQPVIIDNRPGANSLIGTDLVSKSAPDGYTILATVGTHYLLPFLAKNVPYDPLKDFTPITIIAKAPQALVVNSTVPVKSVKELLEYIKKNPGKMSYGTSGAGTSQHLGGELLKATLGLDIVHVPYKGGSQALNDVVGGQIPMALLILSNVQPHVRSGKLRLLAVIESTRAKAEPDIPTVSEAGVHGFSVPDTWIGFLGPAGMPVTVVKRIDDVVQKASQSSDVVARLKAAGFEENLVSPGEFAKQAPTIVETYRKITSVAGIKPE